ncbi:MAG TPA: EcsC family protein [Bacteroidales bacterium]|nr:EcsC family protein [Bacteroidales bacterium]HOX77032.1 EcsC family protein [Bacteroidales bacterium]HPI86113.1 EcsC family protein [Bacteroidales bacterium]HPM92023.1 EcsC family protein [Bacteroidales bacterium]
MPQQKKESKTLARMIGSLSGNPTEIKKESLRLLASYREKYGDKLTEEEIRRKAANKIISNYSYYSAFTGGATSLTGIVPGIGTAIAALGGVSADVVLSMKFQIDMVMAIAAVYGHDIEEEYVQQTSFLVAGIGKLNFAVDEGKRIGAKAFANIMNQYLKKGSQQAAKEITKKLGIQVSGKALQKAIPFGVGVIIGFTANKTLTWYIGRKARDYFAG